MNHNEITKYLDAYIDNQLNTALSKEVKDHISVCQTCQHIIQQRQYIVALLKKHKPYTPASEDKIEKIISHIKILEEVNDKKSKHNTGLWLIVGIILIITQIFYFLTSLLSIIEILQPSLLITIPFSLLPWYINLAFTPLSDFLVSTLHVFQPQTLQHIKLLLGFWHPRLIFVNLTIGCIAISLLSLKIKIFNIPEISIS